LRRAPIGTVHALYFFAGVAPLTAYRILMTWVYGRTGSLLIAVLMYASLIVSTTPLLIPALTRAEFLTWFGASAVLYWAIVLLLRVFGHDMRLAASHFPETP
jgi:hypothetical protein